MHHRSTAFAKLRSSARTAPLAWLAVFALLAQTLLGTPLAARMAIDAAWSDALDPGEALCTAHGADADGPTHRAPATGHHDHKHCVLCQASAAPLLATAAALLGPALLFDPAEPAFFYALAGPQACRAHDAEARAPPGR